MNATTLSVALTAAATDNLAQIASATGVSAEGTYGQVHTHLLINNELMAVRSLSSTIATVTRGVGGTPIQSHPAGAKVLVLSAGELPRPSERGYNAGVGFFTSDPQTITTAGAATYTAQQVLSGLILRDPAGAGRSDVMPTAALLLAEIEARLGGDAPIGLCFEFVIRNDADAAETITLTPGTGGSVTGGGTMTIAQNNSKRFRVRVTGVGGSAAYLVYSLGTVVH